MPRRPLVRPLASVAGAGSGEQLQKRGTCSLWASQRPPLRVKGLKEDFDDVEMKVLGITII